MSEMSEMPISVAIIDDDDLYRTIVTRLLQRSGVAVVFQANNGKAGIDQMSRCSALPSAVILDIEMPVMGGFETARKIKQLWPEVFIIIHSSLTIPEVANRMLNSGSDFFISKSADIDQVANAIKKIVVSKCIKCR
ncbi:response regulator transcription factor [Mucilaginibacter gossypii]|uniref:response regulator n=1 Tax=Mucilaginibacter gossypii TaxID=551996 RepID=UPI000DCB0853|nr:MULTISPECIES: response regulator transcription factor [Mucilaginibacter]QTE39776.1 response regulator transcription factor [Mucilaginibacter gossypii]RAV54156.1 hypothetical protein DIU36_21235 [Mucilaginibacter rubeus]